MGSPFDTSLDLIGSHTCLLKQKAARWFGRLVDFYLDLFYNLVAFFATAQTGNRSLTTRTRRIIPIRERAALVCINV
jgi:hypothetical protein